MADWPSATFKGESFSEIHSYLYKLKQKNPNNISKATRLILQTHFILDPADGKNTLL